MNLRIVLINVSQNSEIDVVTPPFQVTSYDGIFRFIILIPFSLDVCFCQYSFKMWCKLNTVLRSFLTHVKIIISLKKDPKTQKLKKKASL